MRQYIMGLFLNRRQQGRGNPPADDVRFEFHAGMTPAEQEQIRDLIEARDRIGGNNGIVARYLVREVASATDAPAAAPVATNKDDVLDPNYPTEREAVANPAAAAVEAEAAEPVAAKDQPPSFTGKTFTM